LTAFTTLENDLWDLNKLQLLMVSKQVAPVKQ